MTIWSWRYFQTGEYHVYSLYTSHFDYKCAAWDRSANIYAPVQKTLTIFMVRCNVQITIEIAHCLLYFSCFSDGFVNSNELIRIPFEKEICFSYDFFDCIN